MEKRLAELGDGISKKGSKNFLFKLLRHGLRQGEAKSLKKTGNRRKVMGLFSSQKT